jgi:hypothetical protein
VAKKRTRYGQKMMIGVFAHKVKMMKIAGVLMRRSGCFTQGKSAGFNALGAEISFDFSGDGRLNARS